MGPQRMYQYGCLLYTYPLIARKVAFIYIYISPKKCCKQIRDDYISKKVLYTKTRQMAFDKS